MQRRKFIITSLLTTVSTTLHPNVLSHIFSKLPCEELLGQGSPKVFGANYKLRKEAHDAFQALKHHAKKDGIAIQVVSSYRSFNNQLRIWNRKYNAYTNSGISSGKAIKKIIEYSTIPGTSRHHWGTDLDIIQHNVAMPKSVLQEKHFHRKGAFNKLKHWLDKNANAYGFYLVYTNNPNRKGFKYEPWHYSYKPLSKPYLQDYLQLNIKKELQDLQIAGNSHFTNTFIDNYISCNILDINPELL